MTLVPHHTGSFSHPDDPGEPSTGHPRLSITPLEGEILAAVVDGLTVAELGTGLGVSTRALASSASKVYTVDIDEWVQNTIWPDLPDNVETCVDRADLPKVDVVFIDGDHSPEATAEDVAWAMRLARRLIVMHDTNTDDVRSACSGCWRFIETTHGLGLTWL
jgi:predicted RNA methylase